MPEGRIKGYVRAEGLSMLATVEPGHAAFRLFGHRNGRRHFAANNDRRRCRRLLIDLKNFLALER
jgi:hypothetical protein